MIRIILTILLFCLPLMATEYHMSNAGNDNNSGLDWGNAWQTLNKLDTTALVSAGDTVFFNTGTWRGTEIFNVVAGTAGNHTVYACSAFADTNGSGTWHFAKFYGSVDYSDSVWVQHSGNVYRCVNTNLTYNGGLLAQGTTVTTCDSLLWLQSSYANVDVEGEFYISANNDTIYAYMWDLGSGYDPNSYHIEAAIPIELGTEPILYIYHYDGSYVTLYGLQFKYATRHLICISGNNPNAVKLTFNRCKLSHATAIGATEDDNPACIYMPSTGDSEILYPDSLTVTACSLGYVHNHKQGSNHGCAIEWYNLKYGLIDSNTFYGYFTGAVVQSKCSKFNQVHSVGNVVKYNTFNPTYATSGVRYVAGTVTHDSVYGNLFLDGLAAGIEYGCWGGTDSNQTAVGLYIYNNTFYNMRGIDWSIFYDQCPTDTGFSGIDSTRIMNNIFYADSATLRGGSTHSYRRMHGVSAAEFWTKDNVYINYNLYCIQEQIYIIGTTNQIDSTAWANTYSYDNNSIWVANIDSLYFTNPAAGDFSRTQRATGEYNPAWSDYFDGCGAEPIGDVSGKRLRGFKNSFYIDDKNKPCFNWCDIDWMRK